MQDGEIAGPSSVGDFLSAATTEGFCADLGDGVPSMRAGGSGFSFLAEWLIVPACPVLCVANA